MRSRRAIPASRSHAATKAAFKRGAARTARFVHSSIATPAAIFVIESVEGLMTSMEGLVTFAGDFAASAREVNRAMERARAERYTISAHRR